MFSIKVNSEESMTLTIDHVDFDCKILGVLDLEDFTGLDFELCNIDVDENFTEDYLESIKQTVKENKDEILTILQESYYGFKRDEQQAFREDGYGCLW